MVGHERVKVDLDNPYTRREAIQRIDMGHTAGCTVHGIRPDDGRSFISYEESRRVEGLDDLVQVQ